MPNTLDDDELAAYFALRDAGSRLQRAVTKHLHGHGLTEVQFSILARLGGSEEGVAMTELARDLVITKSGLTYQAGQLEVRGLVSRRSSPGDERSILVHLTAQGAAVLSETLPSHVALVRELFIDRMPRQDLMIVRDALARVARDG